MKTLIDIGDDPDGIFKDFFCGSASTAHAIIQQNMSDMGSRKFIMVQMPEFTDNPNFSNIADLGKERINRSIKQITNQNNDQSSLFSHETADVDLGFKVFKYDRSNFKDWSKDIEIDRKNLTGLFDNMDNPLRDEWTKEGLISELLLLEGFPLTSDVTYLEDYRDNELYNISAPDWCTHELFICLDAEIHNNTIRHLEMAEDDIFICLDSALTDELKVRIQDKFNVHVI